MRSKSQTLLRQFFIATTAVFLVSAGCLLITDWVGYRVVALLLLVTVSFCAIFLDILPVVAAAITSAITWNFLFIPPRFTLAIKSAEDFLMFLMYFLVALVHGILTTRIRKAERLAHLRKERENSIHLYNVLLNSLSHELRTPISTIIGASDSLQSMSDKLTEHNKFELMSEISKASLQLNRHVENLLNMSRLESGYSQPKYNWVDIKELVYAVISEFRDTLNGKPINIHIPTDTPLVKLDYGLLYQILHNLIHNAIAYIPKYAVISIHVHCFDEKLKLLVEDSGNGFPPNEIEKVFDKFYRLENTRTGGTGLGLSIVKGLVEAMNGHIVLENLPSAGARFTIEIPCALSYLTTEKA